MLSEIIMTVGPGLATTGPVGLAQGAYGARGNLELVACDALDGLWVFWFNADGADVPLTTVEVPPGRWSGGLAFATGDRYVDAQIVQSTLGPDHLEVLALTGDGVLQSWYWSPGPGFQQRETDAAASILRFRLTHREGALTADLEFRDGATAVVASGVEDYPARSWQSVEKTPVVTDPCAATLLRGVGVTEMVEGTVRAARSTRDGGTTELTWRDRQGRIRHLGLRD